MGISTYEDLVQKIKKLEKEAEKHRHTEETLRESEERNKAILSSSPVGIGLVINRKLDWANEAMYRLVGYEQGTIAGQDARILYSDDEEFERTGKELYAGIKKSGIGHAETRWVRKDGTVFDCIIRICSLDLSDPAKGQIVSVTDISEHKRANEELRVSEEKYRFLIENQTDMIVKFDTEGRLLFVSPSYCKTFDKTEEGLLGKKFIPMIHEEDRETVAKTLDNIYKPPYTAYVEERALTEDGWRWQAWLNTAILNKENEIESIIAVGRDISQQKQAEEALRESEHYLKAAYAIAKLGYWKLNPKTGEVSGSDELFRIFGLTRQEASLEAFTDVVHPDDREYNLYHIKRGMEEGIPWDIEHRLILKDGTEKNIHAKGNPTTDNSGKVTEIIGTIQDISLRKKLQAQLQQAQKMEALGTLGGGIAHDFNNLLMGIQGRTSLMMIGKNSSHPDIEHLKGIENHVQSAADLTKQLLGFARGGKYEVRPIDINELIRRSSKMFGRTKKEIKIHRKYQKDVWPIETDQGQIEQVLVNLYVNAWQAMPDGGELYLQTENVTLDEDYVKPFEIEQGRYVKTSVTDTGVGMDETTRQKIFDPFFTTKEMGRGTGLGLASAYGIIKNHNGFINVYSEKGEGTTFNIYLPASEKEIIEEKASPKDVLRGSETILLVDDEAMIIDVGRQILEHMGYTVVIARSGKEATRIYEKDKGKIDLIILDMIMPDMSGGHTFDRLKEINPDIKVLLSSGYSINGRATEILDRGCNGFIQKPFNMKQLSKKLREILDS